MKIHFTGIGGVGMAGLAVLLKARGHEVTGCDVHASARTRWLEGKGIPVFIGHDPVHVADVDEVVMTPAVRPDEPERVAAQEKRVRFRGEVLADLVNGMDSVAVCGTHGKTTTSTWIAKLLIALGEDVTWCIGGETGDFPVAGSACSVEEASRLLTKEDVLLALTRRDASSTGAVLVVEADESDGTLAQYRAKTLVVNKLEYDHPDHFKTPADYFACFDAARRQAADVVESERLPPADPIFDAILEPLPPHNRKNARAAIEVALRRGHAPAAVAAALPAILKTLPDRRFQRIWPPVEEASRLLTKEDVLLALTRRDASSTEEDDRQRKSSTLNLQVYTDYAHHPTEMACAVAMARKICTGTLRVLFQPHRPSRTKALLADFPAALAEADELVLCPTYMAFEPPVEGGDIADLYKACRDEGRGMRDEGRVFLAQSCEEAWEHACNSMKPGDLTLLLGAGDIIRLVPCVCADMADVRGRDVPVASERTASSAFDATGTSRPRMRRLWIGAGTNMWKSDLNLSVEYVKTAGPAGRPGAEIVREHPGLCPWMAGIPGTVGGWIKMNAGAFGHSFSEVLEAVNVDGEWIPADRCGFSYRHSDIKGEIRDCRLKEDRGGRRTAEGGSGSHATGMSRLLCEEAPKGDTAFLPRENKNDHHRTPPPYTSPEPNAYASRRMRFPPGTYGSFFKNPAGDHAGRLLEAAGAKGLRVGGAFVWPAHANVIVRGEGATGSDVLALARLMRNRVLFRFGIALEPEVAGISLS